MGVFNLYSKRQKKLRGEVPDVYTYDSIPQPLRVQIAHIWNDSLGDSNEYHDSYLRNSAGAYQMITDALCREYGVFRLLDFGGRGDRNYRAELSNLLLNEESTERVMDAIELSFRVIDRYTRNYDYLHRRDYSEHADAAIS